MGPQTMPPRTLTFGIIGHRPNRLPASARAALTGEIGRVLDVLGEAFPGSQFLLVSGLAEGADQMTAKAALERGFRLVAPLPFSRGEFAKDFEAGAVRDAFHDLLRQSDEVVELPGTRADEGEAYEAVGHMVIARADVLIVVWDGGASAGRGGTTEMILSAARLGKPTVHIDAHAKAPTTILRAADGMHLNNDAEIENLDASLFDVNVTLLAEDVEAIRTRTG